MNQTFGDVTYNFKYILRTVLQLSVLCMSLKFSMSSVQILRVIRIQKLLLRSNHNDCVCSSLFLCSAVSFSWNISAVTDNVKLHHNGQSPVAGNVASFLPSSLVVV